jgi:flagellar motor switch protein FliN/FliY
MATNDPTGQVPKAQFGELAGDGAQGKGVLNLDLLLDVPLGLTLEVGRTQISIRDLLALSQGSIVELEKLAGEPLDVLVNGTLVAHGEVVVVNEKFGIRLLDVVSRAERVGTLQE